MDTPDTPHRRRCAAYRREWARRLIARGNPPGHLVPAYGSPTWCALPETDPARIAAVVLAAEAWAWTSDLLPPPPVTVRGDGPDRQGGHIVTGQGGHIVGDQAQPHSDPDRPDNGSATPGSTGRQGDDHPRQGDDHPRQGDGPDRHPLDESADHDHGDGPATPGDQGGQP